VVLPDVMPAQFQATYTPIAAAGTQLQIKHMARLLATQLVAAGLGKGDQQQQQQKQVANTVFIMLFTNQLSNWLDSANLWLVSDFLLVSLISG